MTNYKPSVFLPKSDFSMHGVKDEAAILEFWKEKNLVHELMMGGTSFKLHDGPPYANGNIHMGHALNKILKDFVIRSKSALNYSTHLTPGWDCHGLPIEWQVERNLIKEGKNKADLKPAEFRDLCREYALQWVNEQREQFKALGIAADWDHPYLTLDYKTEAAITRQFHTMLMKGLVYSAVRPTLWSTVEQTALAEAEVEHRDLDIQEAWVEFQVGNSPYRLLVWTTTPWTLPSNTALAYNPNIEYCAYLVKATTNPRVHVNRQYVLAKHAAQATFEAIGVTDFEVSKSNFDVDGVTWVLHPLEEYATTRHFQDARSLLAADFVEATKGTGFVHIAPSHGLDDFNLVNQLEHPPEAVLASYVEGDGTWDADMEFFGGKQILRRTKSGNWSFEEANDLVFAELDRARTLIHRKTSTVSYPHSWRSKAPLIYRATQQWFLNLDDVRTEALMALDQVKFYPETGENRLRAAIGGRPDWLLSRQRIWGSPLAMFVHKDTGEVLQDGKINLNIYQTFSDRGASTWWEYDKKVWFDETSYDPDDYVQIMDVLDVWFDSGSSHEFTGLGKSDLYLEGSDQHRGWFGSSLLNRMAAQGEAPYCQVLTHGFVLDEKSFKMSKSLGNVVDPIAKAKQYGTDVLRLWIALSDYTGDLRVGDSVFKSTQDTYKKLRNTLRYLLGALEGFQDSEKLAYEDLPALEQYVLHQLYMVEEKVREAYDTYQFNDATRALVSFMTDLSSFYFDIRKDSLYCDKPSARNRRACRTVFDILFERLTAWLTPIMPLTIEEAYQTRHPGVMASSRLFPQREFWSNSVVAARLGCVRDTMNAVHAALELKKQTKEITNSLDTHVIVQVTPLVLNSFYDVEAADVFRTSQATLMTSPLKRAGSFMSSDHPGFVVFVEPAEGLKCARSRRVTRDVGSDPRYPDLSKRDADAVEAWKKSSGQELTD